jgi:hypothetical protein
MFGYQLYRHRIYQLSWHVEHTLRCDHEHSCLGAHSLLPRQRRKSDADGVVTVTDLPACCSGNVWPVYGSMTPHKGRVPEWQAAMGNPWIKTGKGLALSIPPAYGRYIGGLLAARLCETRKVPQRIIDKEMRSVRLRLLGHAALADTIERLELPPTPALLQFPASFVNWLWYCKEVPPRPLAELAMWHQHSLHRANSDFVEDGAPLSLPTQVILPLQQQHATPPLLQTGASPTTPSPLCTGASTGMAPSLPTCADPCGGTLWSDSTEQPRSWSRRQSSLGTTCSLSPPTPTAGQRHSVWSALAHLPLTDKTPPPPRSSGAVVGPRMRSST